MVSVYTVSTIAGGAISEGGRGTDFAISKKMVGCSRDFKVRRRNDARQMIGFALGSTPKIGLTQGMDGLLSD